MPIINRVSQAHSRDGLLSSPSRINVIWQDLLDLVFPPRCIGCGRVDARWCDYCAEELTSVPIMVQRRKVADLVPVIATGLHEGKLQEAIQALKYHNVPSLKTPLGGRLVSVIARSKTRFDSVIPVPMHKDRQKQRGYNQAGLLAAYVADALHIAYLPEAIIRERNTPPQVGLNRQERLYNVKDAFHADSSLLDKKSILIIDDVCTTGATIATCAQTALQAGAKRVYAMTVTMATV